MVSVQQFLRGFEYNGQGFGDQGPVDPSQGGFTTSNAPFLFAQLLQQLSDPGGPLSSLSLNQVLAGQTSGLVAANAGAKDQALNQLADSGANAATAAMATGGFEQQLLEQIGATRAAAQENLQERQAKAATDFTNVLAQSEATQKERTEQLRQYESLRKDIKKQNKFNRALGIASLALSFLPTGQIAGAIGNKLFSKDVDVPTGGGLVLPGGGAPKFGAQAGAAAASSAGSGLAGGGGAAFDHNQAFKDVLGLFQGSDQGSAGPAPPAAGSSAPQFQTSAVGGGGADNIDELLGFLQQGQGGQIAV
jgi:hypothetical protein